MNAPAKLTSPSRRFISQATPLAGLLAIERQPISDSRGFLARLFCREEFAALGFDQGIAQINHTLTRQQGTVRGMHFQTPPHAETKFVSCVRGKVFDVAVDLRRSSPTFLQWHAEILSADNHRSLLIPAGFAHGFQTLEPDCELIYLHSAPYTPAAEAGLNALDPRLDIQWPLPIAEQSERDAALKLLEQNFTGIEL